MIPCRHLLAHGGGSFYAVPNPADSFGGQDAVKAVTTDVDDPEELHVAVGKSACSTASPHSGQPNGLKPVTGWSQSIPKAGRARVVAAYGSPAVAAADRPIRAELLETGADLSDVKYSEDLAGSVRSCAATLRYDLTAMVPGRIVNMVAKQDIPWAFCPTGSSDAAAP